MVLHENYADNSTINRCLRKLSEYTIFFITKLILCLPIQAQLKMKTSQIHSKNDNYFLKSGQLMKLTRYLDFLELFKSRITTNFLKISS